MIIFKCYRMLELLKSSWNNFNEWQMIFNKPSYTPRIKLEVSIVFKSVKVNLILKCEQGNYFCSISIS